MRTPIVAGNWKMNKIIGEAIDLARRIVGQIGDDSGIEVVICPPFTALHAVSHVIDSSPGISLGAQDMHWEEKGAFTGEISANMLLDVGCRYVIVGHSERRHIFGETDDHVNRKVNAALGLRLTPIVCVGETLEQREAEQTEAVVQGQITASLSGLSSEDLRRLVLAYEPVWAIGTGRTATPEQANDVHTFIRNLLEESWDGETAQSVRILYGGSVTPDNIVGLAKASDIDGGLVGGASLTADSFVRIVKSVASLM